MAQTGYTPIQIYQSSTAANVPSAANLLAGELAINTADGKLFYKDSVGAVQTLASKNTALIGGANSQIQFNISGDLTGSANLTFTGTTLDVIGTITASNIYANSGTVGATLLSGSLVTAAQPNVTSLGTLTSLAVSGISNLNAIANVRVSGGANGQLIQTDGAGNLSFVTVTTTSLSNGNSNISILANANINFSSTGNANILVVTGTGITVTGNATLGNLTTSNYFTGVLTTAAQPNITSLGTLSSLSVTGTTTAGNIYANSGTIGASLLTGTLSTAAQPNVTSLGTLTSLAVTGNANAANFNGTFYGAATGLTSIPGANVTGTVANATFATSASTVTANAQTNITSLGALTSLTVSGNILSSNVYANTGTIGASLLTGTLSTAAQPNISSLGTLSSLTVTGTISAGNVSGTQIVSTNNGNATNFKVGDDAWIGDINVADTVGIRGIQNPANAYIVFGNADTTSTLGRSGSGPLTYTGAFSVAGNISTSNVTATSYLIRSVSTNISAAGTTQGTATVLSKEINVVTTVLTGNGVVLPTAVAGMVIVITNTNGNSLLVYPAVGATINTLAINAALTQTTGATLQFVAPTTTQWYSVGATYA